MYYLRAILNGLIFGEVISEFKFWQFGIFWDFLGNSLEHVGLSVLYMLGFTVGIFYMISHDTNYGYEKILGLRGDRTGQKTITRSAS